MNPLLSTGLFDAGTQPLLITAARVLRHLRVAGWFAERSGSRPANQVFGVRRSRHECDACRPDRSTAVSRSRELIAEIEAEQHRRRGG